MKKRPRVTGIKVNQFFCIHNHSRYFHPHLSYFSPTTESSGDSENQVDVEDNDHSHSDEEVNTR